MTVTDIMWSKNMQLQVNIGERANLGTVMHGLSATARHSKENGKGVTRQGFRTEESHMRPGNCMGFVMLDAGNQFIVITI